MKSEGKGELGVDVDLFGAPIGQIRERWGRPSFAKSKENQELVAALRACGWTQDRIARHLGCDEKTLRRHFSRELAAGTDLIEGQCIQVLISRMRQGHVPSTRLLLERIGDGRAAVPIAPAEDRPERLGKKAELDRAARTPPPEWGKLLQ